MWVRCPAQNSWRSCSSLLRVRVCGDISFNCVIIRFCGYLGFPLSLCVEPCRTVVNYFNCRSAGCWGSAKYGHNHTPVFLLWGGRPQTRVSILSTTVRHPTQLRMLVGLVSCPVLNTLSASLSFPVLWPSFFSPAGSILMNCPHGMPVLPGSSCQFVCDQSKGLANTDAINSVLECQATGWSSVGSPFCEPGQFLAPSPVRKSRRASV